MNAFEIFFTVHGLIMAVAVANAAGGFGGILPDRHDLRIGWCVPLLRALIWLAVWSGAEAQAINQIELFAALGVAVPYVFISVAMFPRDGPPRGSHAVAHRPLEPFPSVSPAKAPPGHRLQNAAPHTKCVWIAIFA